MNDIEKAVLLGIAIGLLIGAFVPGTIIYNTRNSAWEEECVKHGKAEYYLDDKNERQWRWKP